MVFYCFCLVSKRSWFFFITLDVTSIQFFWQFYSTLFLQFLGCFVNSYKFKLIFSTYLFWCIVLAAVFGRWCVDVLIFQCFFQLKCGFDTKFKPFWRFSPNLLVLPRYFLLNFSLLSFLDLSKKVFKNISENYLNKPYRIWKPSRYNMKCIKCLLLCINSNTW